jgi:hypothetical protein
MMMVFFGIRLYGRINRVPGAFFVATEFFHVMLIPLIPLRTWLVIEPMTKSGLADHEWQGSKLPISLASVLLGWTRGWLGALGAFSLAAALATLGGPHSPDDARAVVLLNLGCWVSFFALPLLFGNATFERARRLLEQAQLPDTIAQKVRREFKRPVEGTWPGRHPANAQRTQPRETTPAVGP